MRSPGDHSLTPYLEEPPLEPATGGLAGGAGGQDDPLPPGVETQRSGRPPSHLTLGVELTVLEETRDQSLALVGHSVTALTPLVKSYRLADRMEASGDKLGHWPTI